MAMDQCLSIITLNVNGLQTPVKRHNVAEWIRKQPAHMLLTRVLQPERHTQAESKGLEKILQANGQEIKQGRNTYIRQNKLENKGHKKKHRRTLHDTQENNPSRKHKCYKLMKPTYQNSNIQAKQKEGNNKDQRRIK